MALPMVMAGPTVMLVIMAMASWPLSTIFERHGARPIMVLASPLGAIGLLVLGLANGPVPYVVSWRSEEHTSELQSLMRISYAVFCLKKKNNNNKITYSKQ